MEFYKETDFKKTEIGMIPKGWATKDLGEIIDIKNGQRPDISEKGSIPVYGANGIMGYTSKNITENNFIILIGRVGASGEVNYANGKIWVSDNAFYTGRYNEEEVDPRYIYYLLKHKKISQYARKSTHPIISLTFLKCFLIEVPKIKEQRQIASILSRVDDAIQKTDEIIHKTKLLKKGLMQELLTKGIGHKEFKYSEELGCEIPKEWDVVKLGEISKIITKGTTPTTYGFKFVEQGINFIKVESIDENGNFISKNIPHISEKANKVFNRSILEEYDILFSIAGALGRVSVVTRDILPANTNQALAIIRLKEKSDVMFEYLRYYLMGPLIQNYITTIAVQSAQANLSLTQVKNFFVCIPSVPEQRQIASILSKVDDQIEKERQTKEQLERLKKGLMQILLTGKIRVKVN